MKIYIVNVSSNIQRRNHMKGMIQQHKCLHNAYFMNDGDIDTITEKIMSTYFGGLLNEIGPTVSCAYKHLLIYNAIKEDPEVDYSLILEDDIYLDKDFCTSLISIIREVQERKLNNFIISLEDSNLKYVNRSLRRKNQLLYLKESGRMAGAYIIDNIAAQSIISEVMQNKCNLPIDWFHNYCSENGIIKIYWAHPTIACQGSLNGKLKSLIDDKQTGFYRIWKFYVSRLYKKIIYYLR